MHLHFSILTDPAHCIGLQLSKFVVTYSTKANNWTIHENYSEKMERAIRYTSRAHTTSHFLEKFFHIQTSAKLTPYVIVR